MKDYYQILGIPPDSSTVEIKKAYRNLAKLCHPDAADSAGLSDKEVKLLSDKFKEVNEANAILSQPDQRRKYDERLKESRRPRRPADTQSKTGHRSPGQRKPSSPEKEKTRRKEYRDHGENHRSETPSHRQSTSFAQPAKHTYRQYKRKKRIQEIIMIVIMGLFAIYLFSRINKEHLKVYRKASKRVEVSFSQVPDKTKQQIMQEIYNDRYMDNSPDVSKPPAEVPDTFPNDQTAEADAGQPDLKPNSPAPPEQPAESLDLLNQIWNGADID